MHITSADTSVNSDPASWWRRICFLPGTRLALSGDLPDRPAERAAHLQRWADSGITHIIDVRLEWTDEKVVGELQPQIRYHWLGVDDDGGELPDEWFDSGVDAALEALGDPTAKVMVHCHMGINRGPSMGLAILLAMGWNPVEAVEAIRDARPIAGLLYADQALDWWQRHNNVEPRIADQQWTQLDDWMREHPIDVDWVISRIHRAAAA